MGVAVDLVVYFQLGLYLVPEIFHLEEIQF